MGWAAPTACGEAARALPEPGGQKTRGLVLGDLVWGRERGEGAPRL